ncbi:right-handed parallel beta-helix repeat-containing protein [Rhodobacter sp. Har01]|uniref:LamG-like jellyroll fold domain-containing protein n=1 Tax=Rhodobacter sp. Har01 TaxID=2883999 RepID=UPI001D085414|nr:LamG-like jellyroll fold domain-containing protein [Rhodobacter sp. Har01]MCB6180123.1 right-handed parallel beta-helix repeat-containing protein [Rhodobacter sp. Har01]
MTVFSVSTAAALKTALSTAKGGDTIKLASGNYGSVALTNLKYASDVTITSADGNQGAKFTTLAISGSSNLRIDGVTVNSASNSGTSVVSITNSTNIDFVNSDVSGKVDKVYPITGPTHGIYVTGTSSGIVVQNNDVHDVLNGLTFFGTKNLTVSGNTVDYIGSDAFKFSGVNTALIENNVGPRYIYSTSDAHEDFMQFQGGASSNVVIRGNVFLPENNFGVQGIFVAGDGGHSNITIEKNVVNIGMLNGIYVSEGSTGVKISYNTVLNALSDARATAIIAPGASVSNNVTAGKTGGVNGTNVVLQHTNPDAPYHYEDLFQGYFRDKGSISLADLKPVAGSLAATKGAYTTVSTMLSGTTTTTTTTTTTPTPTPVAETTPDPVSSGDADAPTAVYARTGDTEFNGNQASVVTVANSSKFALTEGTIAFSFDADTVAGTRAIMSKDAIDYTGGGNHFAVWIDKGQLVVRFQDEDSSTSLTLGGIKANTEYDVMATFDEDNVSLYVNDKLVGTRDFTMDWTANSQKLMLGGFAWNTTQVFDGTISDVHIYDEAMTPADYDFFA